ncbi:MFS transporter [Nakamurella lactea]|uniref:MFS transporter n=1 Tax=Nakamurella lactea TaxID=459515 RepID=UPI000413FAA1|nr:MFS transporter [Nakamurella lactea]
MNDQAVWQAEPAVVAVQRRTVRLLASAQIVGGIGIGAGASLGALLAESVTSSESMAGLARTAATLGAAVVAIPLATLAGRRGRRTSLGLGWAIAAVGGLALVVSAALDSVVILVLGMLMFGSGTATNLQSRYAATDVALPARRAGTLSLVVWSTTIGAVLGPNLSGPGAAVAEWLNLPELAGAFVISAVVLALAALLMSFLRPDPLLLARRRTPAVVHPPGTSPPKRNVAAALSAVRSSPVARFALVTVVLGQTVMAAVMTMTPVHMTHHGASLELVGMTISVHVLGMYAFSPLVGRLADVWGRVQTIVLGQLLFLAAAVLAGLSNSSTVLVTAGLLLLGLGWSCSLVAGSALLVESVPEQIRTSVQGTSDMLMNVFAAIAAGVSGPLQTAWGFGGLNLVAAMLTVPVFVLVLGMRRWVVRVT